MQKPIAASAVTSRRAFSQSSAARSEASKSATLVFLASARPRVRPSSVKGIAVLFPGAGTLRGVFSTMYPATNQRKFDEAGWENAIQQVLAACKEFNVPCGYPANDPATVEQRMKQGFSVFIAGWGDNGFKAVEYGKQASGR